jgi:hypothetical protein
MHGVEYLLALPLICLGSIIKLRTLPLSPLKRVVYALGLIPFTLFSLIMAAIRFPRHAEQRRYILSHSKRGRFWLLKELWKRKLPPATPLYGS